MTDAPPAGTNADQVRYWNETAGPKWVRYGEALDAQLGPLGRRVMDTAAIAPGERVLDVGCGCGDTTLEIGRRVGAGGRVLGVDISAPMLACAAERARGAAVAHVHFAEADAQSHAFERGAFDVVFSRFGVMFFEDPVVAFANLRAALAPAGRLAFVCWQALLLNPWMFVPLQAVARHLTLPPPPAPGAPGPFSLADDARVRDILGRAGFERIDLAATEETLVVGGGGDLDAAVAFLLEAVGPSSAALRDADPAVRPAVTAAVRAALEPFATPGGLRMTGAAWIVTAAASWY